VPLTLPTVPVPYTGRNIQPTEACGLTREREMPHTHGAGCALRLGPLASPLGAGAHCVSATLTHATRLPRPRRVSLCGLHRCTAPCTYTVWYTCTLHTPHHPGAGGSRHIRGRRVARLLHRTHTRTPRSAAHVHKSKRTVSARIHLRRELRAAHGLPPRRRASAARVARVRRRAEVYP
jgi:hypothetical protein